MDWLFSKGVLYIMDFVKVIQIYHLQLFWKSRCYTKHKKNNIWAWAFKNRTELYRNRFWFKKTEPNRFWFQTSQTKQLNVLFSTNQTELNLNYINLIVLLCQHLRCSKLCSERITVDEQKKINLSSMPWDVNHWSRPGVLPNNVKQWCHLWANILRS